MTKNMPDLEKMSTEQKYWFASAIAGMVVADGRTDKKELNHQIEICGIYWHFLLIVWIVLFGLMLSS